MSKMAGPFLAASLMLWSGCWRHQSAALGPPPRRSCLPDPPPPPREIRLSRADAGCPEAFEFCATKGQAVLLYMSVIELRSYANEAHIRCGIKDGGT